MKTRKRTAVNQLQQFSLQHLSLCAPVLIFTLWFLAACSNQTNQPSQHNLTVTKNGIGSGIVISNPTGINCGNDCQETYSTDTTVTLSANPEAGSNFVAFSGCDNLSGNTCTVSMNENKTVTVTFSAVLPDYKLEDGLEHMPGVDGEVKTVTLADPDGNSVTYHYEIIDGLAVFQSDIILGTAEEFAEYENADEIELTPQSTALYRRVCWTFLGINVKCENYRWPNATVPYTFQNNWTNSEIPGDENTMMQQRIRDAMDEIEAVTALRFIPRSSQDDYVKFRSSSGCSAEVGREGGKQHINLSTRCGKGSVIHEILHALGLKHEQTRHDRKDFVQVNFNNIRSGKKHNFETSDLAFDLLSYDYDSIMHYGSFAFCKKDANDDCVGPTLETKPPGTPIGQRSQMSNGDIAAINRLYRGQPPTISITGPSNGTELSRGSNVFFSAEVNDPEGATVTVRWNSNVNGFLGEGTSLTLHTSNLNYGNHVVTASVTDQQGNRASDTVSFSVINNPPQVNIVTPNAGTFCINESISFTADVLDINQSGGTLPGSSVRWRVGSAATFATGKTVSRSFTIAGTYTIFVRGTDERGAFDEDSVTLTIDPCTNTPPVVNISNPATDSDFSYDGFDDAVNMWYKDVNLQGNGSDVEDGNLTGTALVWTTNRNDIQAPVLGTGANVNVRLFSNRCTGVTHEITLTGTDSDGNNRTALRRISISTIC